MTSSTAYLEAVKADEVARELESEGYRVSAEPDDIGRGHGFIATRGDQGVAVQVKARSALEESLDEIRRRRKEAHDLGYGFRLVVVSPPRQVRVRVEGIERTLLQCFQDPDDVLDDSGKIVRVTDVAGVEIDSIEVTASAVAVVGSGVAEFVLAQQDGVEAHGLDWSTDCPFSFDIVLNHDLSIQQVNAILYSPPSFEE